VRSFRRGLSIALPLAVAGIAIFVWHVKTGSSPIPGSVKKQLSFPVLYPQKNTPGLTPQRSSVAYDATNAGLTYVVLVADKKVVVTEQAVPGIFSDAGVYSFKLSQAHDYANFSTAAGEVDLTKPDDLQGQTVAWDNTKTTLILAHAFQNLDTAEWKILFNHLSLL